MLKVIHSILEERDAHQKRIRKCIWTDLLGFFIEAFCKIREINAINQRIFYVLGLWTKSSIISIITIHTCSPPFDVHLKMCTVSAAILESRHICPSYPVRFLVSLLSFTLLWQSSLSFTWDHTLCLPNNGTSFLDMAIGPKVSKRSTLSQNHFQPQFYKWLMFILEFSRTE